MGRAKRKNKGFGLSQVDLGKPLFLLLSYCSCCCTSLSSCLYLMQKYFLPILFSIILSGCSTAVKTFQTIDAHKIGVQSSKFRGTIFKSSYPEEKLFISPGVGYKRITLTNDEIVLAETILKQQLKTMNRVRMNQLKKREYIDKNLPKYFRQYIGFIDEKGNRIVHINCHWDNFSIVDRLKGYWDSRLEYTSDYSIVFDGGSRYWSVNVDLSKKELYGLSVNGLA